MNALAAPANSTFAPSVNTTSTTTTLTIPLSLSLPTSTTNKLQQKLFRRKTAARIHEVTAHEYKHMLLVTLRPHEHTFLYVSFILLAKNNTAQHRSHSMEKREALCYCAETGPSTRGPARSAVFCQLSIMRRLAGEGGRRRSRDGMRAHVGSTSRAWTAAARTQGRGGQRARRAACKLTHLHPSLRTDRISARAQYNTF